MKKEGSNAQQKKDRKTVNKLCSVSGFVLSVVCCVAIIRVEVRIQQHDQLISDLATFCDQMKKDIPRKVQRYHDHGKSKAMKDQQWTEPIGNL